MIKGACNLSQYKSSVLIRIKFSMPCSNGNEQPRRSCSLQRHEHQNYMYDKKQDPTAISTLNAFNVTKQYSLLLKLFKKQCPGRANCLSALGWMPINYQIWNHQSTLRNMQFNIVEIIQTHHNISRLIFML